MGTGRARALLAVLVAGVLAAGGAAAVSLRSGPVAQVLPVPSPTSVVREALLPEVPEQAPAPTAGGLQLAVETALADPAIAGRLAVSVVDAQTGDPLLERGAP